MNPNDYQPRPQSSPQTQWFNAASAPIEPESSGKSPKKKILLLIIVVVICLTVIATAFFVWRTDSTSVAGICMDKNEYQTLMGRFPGNQGIMGEADLKPDAPFYTHDLYFEGASSSFDAASQSDINVIAESLAKLYKESRQKNALTVSLSAAYLEDQNQEAVETRLAATESFLLEAGIPSDRIVTSKPHIVTGEDDYVVEDAPVTLSISAGSSCL